MAYILALDQGTTSSRAFVFDGGGALRGFDQREVTQYFPQPGWVEHDADEIWTSQLATARGALRAAGIRADEVAAIGIANQRETTVLWERASGRPVHRAIVWQDRRTAAECATLQRRAGYADLIARTTGLRLDPYFSATKIAWLLDTLPTLRERAERGDIAFGTIDCWLLWKLTDGRVHATDATNASRTLLFDLRTLDWSEELLHVFGVPRAVLPEIRPTMARFGMAGADHLGAAVAIAAVAGDQQAALVGQAGFVPGIAKNTYGTGSFVMLHTGERIVRSAHGLLATVALGLASGRATYALEGSIFTTGAAVAWLRDGLGLIDSAGAIEALAASVADSGGVYFVPAFAGLGAPHWDPFARGTLVGLSRGTTRAHVARAALEAIAFQSAEVIGAMERDADARLTELRVDGGAAGNDLLLQLQADLLGADVVRPAVTETTGLGAAYLAGLQSGMFANFDDVAQRWHVARRFRPTIDAGERGRRSATWLRAVERAKAWAIPP